MYDDEHDPSFRGDVLFSQNIPLYVKFANSLSGTVGALYVTTHKYLILIIHRTTRVHCMIRKSRTTY
jgi:hypothetical protein